MEHEKHAAAFSRNQYLSQRHRDTEKDNKDSVNSVAPREVI